MAVVLGAKCASQNGPWPRSTSTLGFAEPALGARRLARVFFSLVVVVFQAFMRRPSRAWGMAVLSSFVLMLAFAGISNAVYSPASSPPQEGATILEKAEESPKATQEAAAKNPRTRPSPKPKRSKPPRSPSLNLSRSKRSTAMTNLLGSTRQQRWHGSWTETQ